MTLNIYDVKVLCSNLGYKGGDITKFVRVLTDSEDNAIKYTKEKFTSNVKEIILVVKE